MSSETTIAVSAQDLGKCYEIYAQPRDRLKQFVIPRLQTRLSRPTSQYYREFWALRDVSFEVHRGEAVGIIGRNGSGKSTLLQMICGTVQPTLGQVSTNGRVAALLELGSGFNPDFTGRENVYMNAAVLGLNNKEIDQRFDSIAAFADIGDFIEQPTKTYSSGMMVRLAFSVAINVDPDILIVDEALAVGDELFQRKCFARLEAIRAAGATILFVSHSGAKVVELSDRAILLDSGERLATGRPKQIFGYYQKMLYAPAHERARVRQQIQDADAKDLLSQDAGNPESPTLAGTDTPATVSTSKQQEPASMPADIGAPAIAGEETFDPNLVPTSRIDYESHGAHILEPQILNESGDQVNHLIRGHTYYYCYKVRFDASASGVRFGMLIRTLSGVSLGGASSARGPKDSLPYIPAGNTYQVQFQFRASLNTGTYFLNAGVLGATQQSGEKSDQDIADQPETYLHRVVDIAMFKIVPDQATLMTHIVDFECLVNAESLTQANSAE